MKRLERTYANVIVQMLSLCFLTLYLIFTQGAFPLNFIWFIVTLLLAVVGISRKINEAILVSLLAVAAYGGFLIYNTYTSLLSIEVTWNDLVWLGVFPFFAIIGGLHKGVAELSALPPKRSSLTFKMFTESDEQETDHSHRKGSKLGYLAEESLALWLEKELPRIIRSDRELTLLGMAIEELDSFRLEYGDEQTLEFMQRIAELIHYVIGPVEAKALLDDNTFAIVFIGKEQLSPKMAQLELEEQFGTLLLTRPRRERNIKMRLRFAAVQASESGQNVHSMIEQVKQQLHPHTE